MTGLPFLIKCPEKKPLRCHLGRPGVGEVVHHMSPWGIRVPGRGNSKSKVLRQKYAQCVGTARELMCLRWSG